MQLDNIEEVKVLLSDIDKLFMNLDNVKSKLEIEIAKKEGEQEDYLHELEIAKLNGIEIRRVSNALIKVRKERRILKDKLDVVKTLKGYTDKFITKGITAETKQVIKNLDTLKKNQETRIYVPRVVKDLKCAQKAE